MIINKYRWSAGFGSCFLQLLDWYWYSSHTNIPIYAEWDHNNSNFFNDFFVQKQKKTSPHTIVDSYYTYSKFRSDEIDQIRYKEVPLYKKYNDCFFGKSELYAEDDFKNLLKMHNKLFVDNLSIKSIIPKFNFENTLGVHARYIGHFYTDTNWKNPLREKMSESDYYEKNINQIQETFEKNNFNNIYIGCDDEKFLEICKNHFKDKLLFQNYKRHLYHNFQNRYSENDFNVHYKTRPALPIENYNALVDIIALSSCQYLIGSVSSFTFSALVFNPDIRFNLFNTCAKVITT